MLDVLLPQRLDNEYRGSTRLALRLFGLVVAMKSAQSLAIIFNGYPTARRGRDSTRLIHARRRSNGGGGLRARIALAAVLLSLVRARPSSIPKRGPLDVRAPRVELRRSAVGVRFRSTPPRRGADRALVNLLLFVVMLVGLGLSVWRRGGSVAQG